LKKKEINPESKMKKFLLLFTIVLYSSVLSKIYASHVMGADLTFSCQGPNTYLVTLEAYRDCNGIQLTGPLQINYSSVQCGVNSTLTLDQVGPPTDITPSCFANTDACNGGTGYGIQKFIFQGTLHLPPGCGSDWVLSWTLCCRNAAITTLNNPGNDNLYIEANLNNTISPCVNSPTFSNDPIAIYCDNFPQFFNHGATAPNGDSLHYYLMPSLTAAGTSVSYNSGYSATNPLSTSSGTSINPLTGQLSFTPNQTQVAVMKVGVDEYQNGVLIAHVERDMQVIVTTCNNSAPNANGINGQTGANANTFTTTACSNFCFTIQTTDANTTDSVFYSWVGTNLPGATITSSGGLKPLLTICWAPTQADVGTHNFVINLRNNDCPYYGTASIAYTVVVNGASDPPVSAGPDVHLCPGQSTTLTATSAGTISSYNWSDGTNTHSGATWTVSPAITTIYTVTAVYANGCQLTDQVVVYRDVAPTVSAFPLLTTLCSTSDTVQLSAFSNDPTAAYTWSPAAGLTCTTCANPKASPAATTTYSLVAKDSAGCPSNSVSVTVALAPPPPSQSCSVIYASPTGTGSGTQNSPASLQAAIDSAACNNALIKLAIGTYTIDNPITNITSYTTLEGGFDPANDWRKTSQPGATTIYRSALNIEGAGTNNERIVAIYMNGNNYFRFQDVTIQTADCPALAAGDTYGYSNYALHLTNCSNYVLDRCQVITGNATAGLAGTSTAGTGGGPGTPGVGGAGGAGAGTGCNKTGTGGTAGTSASTGASGGGGGAGGSGGSCNFVGCGVNASSGTVGIAGTAGTAGTSPGAPGAPGTTTTFFNVGAQSAAGTNGGAGGGGGGGGGGQNGTDCTCSINGSAKGGNGGDGGSGGLGGGGGYGGGGSFGIYLFNNGAGASYVDCSITAGSAGTGGSGGTAQQGTNGVGGSAGVSTTGSCNPLATGGTGGNGGNGAAGGNGQAGAPGVTAEIVSNGTVPTYTSAGAATTIATGINNPVPFAFAAQAIIFAANISCTNRNDTLSSAASGTWTTGAGATNAGGTGAQIYTQYTTTGRKDIGYNGSAYTGFVNIAIDQNSFVPVIQSSAPVLQGDTFWVCKGSTADFSMQIASADTFDWNFGGATVPNTYTGHDEQNLSNLTFNIAGTFRILARIETSCCGWSPYDTAYIVVEPNATLAYTGATSFCPGDSAHIILSGTGSSYSWAPAAGLSSDTATDVYAFPQATTSYLVTSYSPRGLCNADTTITVTRDTQATVSFNIIAASCGSNGSITAVPTPAGNYSYQWSPTVSNSATITNQPSGTYFVTVTPVGSSCTAVASTSLGTNGGLQAYMAKNVSPPCNGSCVGQLRVEAIGGVAPYSYQWSPSPSSIDSLNNLCAGTYNVTITDNNNCTSSTSGTVVQPLPLSVAVLDSVSPVCGGQCTGSAKVDGQGGTGPYSFVWTPGNIDSSHGVNLCVGFYSIAATDANGCPATGGVTISAPPAIVEDTVSTTDEPCFGNDLGEIILKVSGGKYPYTYVWPQAPGITDSIASPLTAGTYTPKVIDSNGCRDSITVVITQPQQLVATVIFDSIACAGQTADTAIGNATGGTQPYTYQLDGAGPFQISGMFTALSVGNHTITVQDANGCTSPVSFTMYSPTALSASIVSTFNNLCFDSCNGIINVTASGGVSPYLFALSTGQNITTNPASFTGLCANPSYTINITDSHGCPYTLNDSITQPSAIVPSFVSATPPTCNNGTNGAFTVTATGGMPNYTYSSDGGAYQASGSFSPASAGSHVVTVMDANGCKDTITVTVPNPPPTSSFTSVITNVTCPGGNNGSVTLTLTGTVTPYTYTWSPGNVNTENDSNLSAGLYQVTVTDGNGCRVFGADSNTVTEPMPITTVNTPVEPTCFNGSDGSVQVVPSGGTSPFASSWSNGSTATDLSGIPAGTYSDTLTDANGCTYIDAGIVVGQPDSVSISIDSVSPVSCIGFTNGAIYLTVSGGTPGYTYVWSPSGSTDPLLNLGVGPYTVIVTDSHGCPDTANINVPLAPQIALNAIQKNIFCPPLQDGAITLAVTGGSPAYQYIWSNGATTSQLTNLGVGVDSVTVTDSRGCNIDTGFVISNDTSFRIVASPDTVTINEGNNTTLSIDPFFGTGDDFASIAWSPGLDLSCSTCQSTVATPLHTIQYTIQAVSDSGCTAQAEVLVIVIPQDQLYVPNAFTPDGNGINDDWQIYGNKKVWKFVEAEVYDRWGERVFESTDLDFAWNGKYKGNTVEPGVYVYTLRVTFIDGHTVNNKGSLTVIR
jgi:gliding motility-associated-like protein